MRFGYTSSGTPQVAAIRTTSATAPAVDVYLEHTVPNGWEGFIGLEVKYHERLDTGRAGDRRRPTELARRSGLFEKGRLMRWTARRCSSCGSTTLLTLSMLQQATRKRSQVGESAFEGELRS